jgi:ribonuclease-3
MSDALTACVREIFTDHREPLAAAFTRRSFLEEQRGPGRYSAADHHQRLETLGDAWLGAILLRRLHDERPDADEGELTSTRSALVNNKHLAAIARIHKLEDKIRAGAGEVQQGQHVTQASLASHVEAMIGAAIVVGGEPAASRLIEVLFAGRSDVAASPRAVDHKSELTRREQAGHHRPTTEPKYAANRVPGTPDHAPRFTATVTLFEGRSFTGGEATTKQGAEQDAAREALEAE